VSHLCFDSHRNLYATLRVLNTVVRIPAGTATPATFATGFSDPTGIVCDSHDNLFVCNYGPGASRVDKVTPGGVRTTFATGLANPGVIVIDAQDNLYVGEFNTQTVKEITPDGTVTTYGSAGFAPGDGLTALCLLPDGSLLCGTYNGPFKITSIPPGGGTGSVICTPAYAVLDILRGPNGYFYITSYLTDVITRSVLPAAPEIYAGKLSTPGFVDGPLLNARFNLPAGMALDTDGLIYIADYQNDAIRVLNDPITGPTPVEHGSWGRLKSKYRK
jgi:sugar lactone lactonase YvrE